MSLELRWFFQGKVPEEIKRWFNKGFLHNKDHILGKEQEKDEAFQDIYLFNPEVNYSSVKFRNNNIIIKWKNSSSPINMRINNMNISGIIEEWTSLEIKEYKNSQEIHQHVDKNNNNHPLIKINKNRQRYTFEISKDNTNRIELLKTEQDKNKADCSIELSTAILEKNKDISWWTTGVELIEEDKDNVYKYNEHKKHVIEAISKILFKNYPQNNLIEIRSYGYPQLFSMYADSIKSSNQ
jgi:hypothetical protein